MFLIKKSIKKAEALRKKVFNLNKGRQDNIKNIALKEKKQEMKC